MNFVSFCVSFFTPFATTYAYREDAVEYGQKIKRSASSWTSTHLVKTESKTQLPLPASRAVLKSHD